MEGKEKKIKELTIRLEARKQKQDFKENIDQIMNIA